MSKRQTLFLICLFAAIVINLAGLYQEHKQITKLRTLMPHQSIGQEFEALRSFTKNIEYMGFYTDLPEEDTKNAATFSQAQYILAPTILDYNNTNHEFILFVCSRPEVAMQKIKEIGAIPLKANGTGMILARRR